MLATFLVGLFTLIGLSPYAHCGTEVPNFCDVEYNRTIDGDTIAVNIEGQHDLFGKDLRIRVRGIDTPPVRTKDKELKEKGLAAMTFVQAEMEGAKKLNITDCIRDKWFRLMCDVYYDDKNLADEVVSQGFSERVGR